VQAGPPKFRGGTNFEGTEEREWSRILFREPPDVRPVAACEVEGPDLSSVGRKQYYGTDRSTVVGEYIEWISFRAFEEGFHIDLALWKE